MIDASIPLFETEGSSFIPTEAALGSWGAKRLDGRAVVALLGAEIEHRHRSPDQVPARLTVDLFRLPDASPIEVRTRVVRENRRLTLVDAEFISGGEAAARATCQLLLKSENPEDQAWAPEPWNVPPPDQIQPPTDARLTLGGKWNVRPICGRFGKSGRRRTWLSELRPVVRERPITPFVRVAAAADLVSAFANFGASVLTFINTDLTIYLHREPETEWIGFDVVSHGASAGVAFGECALFDEAGAIGTVSCTALAQPRRPKP
jgi:hypothetical protein